MDKELTADSDVKALWAEFKNTHEKAYSAEEETNRFEIFSKNIEKIIAHNEKFAIGQSTHKMKLNKFADMTIDECNAMRGVTKK